MALTKKDKQDIVEIFNQGINELILPVLDDMNKKMATKEDLQAAKIELRDEIKQVANEVDSLHRKFDAQQNRLDRHAKDIQNLQAAIA